MRPPMEVAVQTLRPSMFTLCRVALHKTCTLVEPRELHQISRCIYSLFVIQDEDDSVNKLEIEGF
jgi:hypothetical protein